jgi:hypothetical protein
LLDHRGQFLRAALGFAGLPRPSYDLPLHALRSWLDSWGGIGHVAVGMARQGYDLQLTRLRRTGLARDVLRERNGALSDERDRHRVGAHAVACDAAGGVGGVGEGSRMTKRRALMPGLGLMVTLTSAGCAFDDTYMLWTRYSGPGGNVWRIEQEFKFHIFPSATSSNRLLCERELANRQIIAAKVADDMKNIGKTLGPVDYFCLPKGMHP